MAQVTINYEIRCEICKHERTTEVFCDTRNLLVNIPEGWAAIPQEGSDLDALLVFFYCPEHHPRTVDETPPETQR